MAFQIPDGILPIATLPEFKEYSYEKKCLIYLCLHNAGRLTEYIDCPETRFAFLKPSCITSASSLGEGIP